MSKVKFFIEHQGKVTQRKAEMNQTQGPKC